MKKSLIRNTWLIPAALVVGLALGLLVPGKSGDAADQGPAADPSPPQIWTCSMHPQVRLPEPGDCPICGMDLIPVPLGDESEGLGEYHDPHVHTLSAEAAALAEIRTVPVVSAETGYELRLTGKIAVDERRIAAVTADVTGRIERLFVNFTGQAVRKGQKLAEVYSPELVTAQQELLEAAKLKSVYPALHEAAREKMRLWNISQDQIEAVESRGHVLAVFDIAAPADGVVLARNIARGDYASRGDVLFEIADLRTVWVLFDAYESDLAWIRPEQTAVFTVEALPGREFLSTVRFIDPQIDMRTRTAAVRAEVSNADGALKPGMFVRAKIAASIAGAEATLLVPRTAVLWTGPRSVVWIRRPGEHTVFEMREITLGPRAGDYDTIVSGLAEGEEVVIHGVFALDAAAQLSGRYSMMNRPESVPGEIPPLFLKQFDGVTGGYLALQQALAFSQLEKGRESVKAMLSSLAGVDMSLLREPYHGKWMKLRAGLSDALEVARKASDLEALRAAFLPLSLLLIEISETFGPSREPLYIAHCPMAFDNSGGDWITAEPKIENPYFGDRMFSCGDIKGRITRSKQDDKKRPPLPASTHIH
ncbi:MAG: efflux RND transporter periplasmic adaptor subunit [Acidobacteriota bacterium]|nr:efflux RND transporter periplasmic adaptor subunit [Acidobacteriota bacterium]